MVSSEDFSFPKISNPLPHFAISPSLWRVSSVVYPDDYREEDEERNQANITARKSFSCLESSGYEHGEMMMMRASDVEEEKMDLLWEDFNEEELQMVSSLNQKKQQQSDADQSCSKENTVQKRCCVKSLKKSETAESRMICHQPKRQNMVVVFKILKKIFLLHNSAKMKKNNQ